MWDEILKDLDLTPETVHMGESFVVGDAAGRIAVPGIDKDFSASDRQAPSPLPPFHTSNKVLSANTTLAASPIT